jgi:hypothetical protein
MATDKDPALQHSFAKIRRSAETGDIDGAINRLRLLYGAAVFSDEELRAIDAVRDEIKPYVMADAVMHMRQRLFNATMTRYIRPMRQLGAKWPELDTVDRAIEHNFKRELGLVEQTTMLQQRINIAQQGHTIMKISELVPNGLLTEALGNLEQLDAAPLIALLRQDLDTGYRRKSRNNAYLRRPNKKWQDINIGSTSPIIDGGVLKKGIATLRKLYREYPDTRAFALYVGSTAVVFGVYDAQDISGRQRIGKVAYDLTPFKQQIEQIDAARNADKPDWSKTTTKITTLGQRSPTDWETRRGEKGERYIGIIKTVDQLGEMIDTLSEIGKMVGDSVKAKLVLQDKEAITKRQSRDADPRDTRKSRPRALQGNQFTKSDIRQGRRDLLQRLEKYRLNKAPTIDNIEDFVKQTLENPGVTVTFGGLSYKLNVSGWDRLEKQELFSGKPFNVRYGTVTPGADGSVIITFVFDAARRMLVPVTATWTDKSDNVEQTAVLDQGALTRSKLNVRSMDKQYVLQKLLVLAKTGKRDDALDLINSMIELGHEWPELKNIKTSIERANAARNA